MELDGLDGLIRIRRVDNVKLRRRNKDTAVGSLVVTGHHLVFIGQSRDDELMLLHKGVDLVAVEKQGGGGRMTLKCKNFAILTFEISSMADCEAVAESVNILSNLMSIPLEFAFTFTPPFTVLEDGWTAFSSQNEFARLQIHTDFWRVSSVNKDFKVCASYPEQLIVPRKIDDSILIASSKFREGGRFPVLSYFHKETRSALIRCGQPLVGQSNRRCREDETLVNALAGSSARGYICDTRSQPLAQAAKNKGGGYELEHHYPIWKRLHYNIPKWTQTQDSLQKMVEACNDANISMDKWLSKLNGSGWLQGISELLHAACIIAQSLDREGSRSVPSTPIDEYGRLEMSVVVHGGDGMDSTLQLTSLVQIILDPDARTVRGFESVVEREWVMGGHPFGVRNCHGPYAKGKTTGPNEAPSFLMFIDAVWQIYNQYPCSFEFTEEFLIFLADESYASQYGTFLGNSEKSKQENRVKNKTVSLWSFVNHPENLQRYLNPYYDPNPEVWPSVAPQSLQLWERMYLRWTRDWSAMSELDDQLNQWKLEEKQIVNQVTKLRRQIIEMEREHEEESNAS